MTLLNLALVLTGALVGGAFVWLIRRGKTSAEIEQLRERSNQLGARLEDIRAERDALRDERDAERQKTVRLTAEKEHLEEKLSTQKEEINKLQEQFADQFENLAQRVLDEKSAKFTEQNKESLNQLLDPLQEKIEQFQKKVEEKHEKDIEARASLKQRIQNLTELNRQMSAQAQDLVEALEGQSKTQGDWGEMILERILEESGLQKGREYVVQESVRTADGDRQRPDVVVRLPDDRHVVIDAKVSITAYRRHVSADDDAEQRRALKQHVASVRRHVDDLSEKNYPALHEAGSPDFVLLFIPVEPAFAAALRASDGLYQEAFRKNVVIVSPTTLLATLATIATIWKQEYQNQNAREIARRGGRLYDKFCLFAEALDEVGQRLDQAQDSYATAMKRLRDGKGNLVRQAEMLRELGADVSKQLPARVAPAEEEGVGEEESGKEGKGE